MFPIEVPSMAWDLLLSWLKMFWACDASGVCVVNTKRGDSPWGFAHGVVLPS